MFQVKDLDTGAPLLKGLVKDGSYEWPYSSSLGDFSVSKSSLSHWHHRLGHPAFPILKTITSSFLSSTLCYALESTPCNSCLLNKSHKLPFSTTTISSTLMFGSHQFLVSMVTSIIYLLLTISLVTCGFSLLN